MKPQKKELAKIIITPEGDYDVNKEYCPLSIVNSNYKTYISKTQVPKGIPVENEDYWMNIASGPSGTIDEITVEVNNKIGIPEAEIELDGTPQNRILHFKFKNIKGEKGDKGDKGDKGEPFVYEDLTDEQKAEINGVGIVTEQGGIIFLNSTSANRFSLSCGDGSHSDGQWAVSFGYRCASIGNYSFCGGQNSEAGADNTFVYGINCSANVNRGISIGYKCISNGDNAISIGNGNNAYGYNSIAFGYKCKANNDSLALGNKVAADGIHSISIGWKNTSKGDGGITLGIQNNANGGASFCCGTNNTTDGASSFSMGDGNNALGFASIAFNRATKCNADIGTSLGYKTECNSYSGLTIGYVNEPDKETQTSNYDANNIAFCIGNGIDNYGKLIRSNAFKIKFDGTVYSDNTSIQPNADYAEMFEWNDGNEFNEDRVGYFVTLIENKITKANTNSKYILGIISSTPSIIGNAPMRWQGKYLNDEWGRPIYENIEVTYTETISEQDENGEIVFKEVQKTRTDNVRKINPDYNPDQEYIPRENRKEWDAVGLLGKLLVRQDGTLIANEFCYPNADGIATKSESGYYVTKIINENIAEVIFK